MTRTASTKRTAIKKPKRKKVAPKVVSNRPRKDPPGSSDSIPVPDDTNDTSILIVTTSTTQSYDATITIETPPLSQSDDTTIIVTNETTPTETTPTLSLLDEETQAVPLPTLPEEGSGIHTPPLELPDADDIVGDLFTGERTGPTVEADKNSTDEPLPTRNASLTPTEAEKSVKAHDDVTEDVTGPLTPTETSTEKEVVVQNDGRRRSKRRGRSISLASSVASSLGGDETIAERSEVVATGNVGKKSRKRLPSRSRKRQSPPDESCDNETTPPRTKKRRVVTPKERKAPDRNTMTMQELIYYNPTANPMQAALEQRVRQRGSTSPASPEKATPTKEDSRQTSPTGSNEERDESRIVPQLRIGNDGRIVIDENSMIMATTQSVNPYSDEAVVETSGQISSGSFRSGYKITRWTKDETSQFFKALSHVGTDFTMMALLVPKRSRKELKNKFKREEKRSPDLVAEALKNQVRVVKAV